MIRAGRPWTRFRPDGQLPIAERTLAYLRSHRGGESTRRPAECETLWSHATPRRGRGASERLVGVMIRWQKKAAAAGAAFALAAALTACSSSGGKQEEQSSSGSGGNVADTPG